jgi:hypothetical protein
VEKIDQLSPSPPKLRLPYRNGRCRGDKYDSRFRVHVLNVCINIIVDCMIHTYRRLDRVVLECYASKAFRCSLDAEIILECPIPKNPGCQAAAVMPNFEAWLVLAQFVVAHIAVVFGLAGIFLGFGKDIPGPCFDIACRVGVGRCLQRAAIVWVTGGGTAVGEEIVG